jgi:hypothetical protein
MGRDDRGRDQVVGSKAANLPYSFDSITERREHIA